MIEDTTSTETSTQGPPSPLELRVWRVLLWVGLLGTILSVIGGILTNFTEEIYAGFTGGFAGLLLLSIVNMRDLTRKSGSPKP